MKEFKDWLQRLARPAEPVAPETRPGDRQLGEESFRLLVEGVRDYAIFLLDADGRVMSWNRGAERLKGYRSSEIIGRHFSVFYTDSALADGWPDHQLKTAAVEGRFEDEGWRVRKDGTRFWANVILTAMYDSQSRLYGFSKITRDLTERKEAEDRLVRAGAELARRVEERTADLARVNDSLRAENAERLRLEHELRERLEQVARADIEKEMFLATLSHELRTPLNAIVGWVHMLREGLDGDAARRAVEAISRSAEAQTRLISDILDIQRMTSGKLRLNLTTSDFASSAHAAVETVRPAALARNIDLEVDASAGRALPVLADTDRLQQVVWNLLSNAVKFSPAGGRVKMSLVQSETEVGITIEDEGPGIEPEFLPYVFDRFRQGDVGSTRKHGGLGLGLAIARSLVELHGGRVRAANRRDRTGARFEAHLPRWRGSATPALVEESVASAEATGASTGSDAVPPLYGVRLLLVDDEPDSREVIAAMLEGYGASVLVAPSAAEGLAMLLRHRPHVILSDIEMPEEDGYDFLRKVRALPPEQGGQTPAAALTAYAGLADRTRALSAGFQLHVAKPVKPAELLRTVAALARGGGPAQP